MKAFDRMGVLRLVEGAFVTLILVIVGVLAATNVHAQSVTFGASVTNANGSLTTSLTWSTTPAATSCTASGSPSWTGAKAASGTQALPPINMSGTYNLSLLCTWPGDSTATLSWVAPTTNTDGTALAKCADQVVTGSCLRGYSVNRDTASGVLPDVVAVNDRNALGYVWTGLAAGTHYFTLQAVNGNGVMSSPTGEVSKVIAATQTRSSSVTLTVNPMPAVPGGFTVQ